MAAVRVLASALLSVQELWFVGMRCLVTLPPAYNESNIKMALIAALINAEIIPVVTVI